MKLLYNFYKVADLLMTFILPKNGKTLFSVALLENKRKFGARIRTLISISDGLSQSHFRRKMEESYLRGRKGCKAVFCQAQ